MFSLSKEFVFLTNNRQETRRALSHIKINFFVIVTKNSTLPSNNTKHVIVVEASICIENIALTTASEIADYYVTNCAFIESLENPNARY